MYKLISLSLILLFIFSACNSNKDKALYDQATKKINESKFSEAVKDLNELIEEFPNSDFAKDSYFSLASMYHMYQVPNIGKEESLKKAVENYTNLYKNFPDSDKAPKALFTASFIKANELNKIDEARLSYQEFIDKFPKDELASQAKFELDNLGKSPEEILQSNVAKK